MSEPNGSSWTSLPTPLIERKLREASTDPVEQRALLALLTDRLTCELIEEVDGRTDTTPHTDTTPRPATRRSMFQRSVPAGWHPDPSGRHQVRWWDGKQWTQYASDSGPTLFDPL